MSDAVALPKRWRPWQRRKNTLIYHVARALLAMARRVPFVIMRHVARFLALLGFVFAVRERRRAIRQIREALPGEKHPAWLTLRVFLHFGEVTAEWADIGRFTAPASPHTIFTPETEAVLRGALAGGKGALFVSPHLGNWEILAQATAQRDIPCDTIAKESYDPRFTRMMQEFRAQGGVRCLWRGDPKIMWSLRDSLKRGRVLGALIDQDTKVPSVFVPFFGKLAATPVVPALLAVRLGAAVVFGYAVREGRRYRVHFEEVAVQRTGDHDADAFALTADLTRRAEAAIRRYPEQWVWLHDRFKTRPEKKNGQGDLPQNESSTSSEGSRSSNI